MQNPYTASGSLRQPPEIGMAESLLGAELLNKLRQGSKCAMEAGKNMRMAAGKGARMAMRAAPIAVPLGTGVLGVLDAFEELEDNRPGETRQKNIADAIGRGGGSIAGTVLGAGLGMFTGVAAPIVSPLLAIAGSKLLGDGGRALAGGLYNIIDDPKARAKKDIIESIEQSLKLQYDAALLQKGLEARAANDALQRANEANFYNTANQTVLNSGAVANNMLANIGNLL